MKRLSLAVAVALGLGSGPVSAADMPVKAAPPVAPALYNWSGVYIGVEGGAVMGQRTEWEFLFIPDSPFCGTRFPQVCADVGHPLHGGFVGGEAGFNWQSGRWVFGIEGDGNWAELEEALTCAPYVLNVSCGSKIRDFETVRARLGYGFGPTGSFLVFVTGGWATANVDVIEASLFPPFGVSTDRERHNGFVVGGGAEYGITPWLSLKGEVLYVWLEGRDHCFGNCAKATGDDVIIAPAHVKMDFIAARMGLNWLFNWGKGKGPAPVVASY